MARGAWRLRPCRMWIALAWALVLALAAFGAGAWSRMPLPDRPDARPAPVSRLDWLETGVRLHGAQNVGHDAAAQRRGLLASLAAIQVQRPKLVVLEDWMEEPSQEEARNLLGSLQGGVEALPLARRESRNQMAGLLESFQRQLQVDHDLALFLAENPNIWLPVGMSPQNDAAAGPGGRGEAERIGFKVSLRGGLEAHLLGAWDVGRAPHPLFTEAAALSAADLAADSAALQVVFGGPEGRWVAGLGLDAALGLQDLGHTDLRFQWKGKRLAGVWAGGYWVPMNEAGQSFEPRREAARPLQTLPVDETLRGDFGPARLAGKVVFFRPWPGQLRQAAAFDRQQRVFAGILQGRLEPARPGRVGRAAWVWAWLGIFAATMASPWRLKPVCAALAAGGAAWALGAGFTGWPFFAIGCASALGAGAALAGLVGFCFRQVPEGDA